MRQLLTKLWADDRGVLEAIEFLLTAGILVFGLVAGLATVRNAITAELQALADAVLALNFSFSVGGLSGCCASVAGSQLIQTPATPVPPFVCTPPVPIVVTVNGCP
jgi:Flp pilus assembly pilin Flp